MSCPSTGRGAPPDYGAHDVRILAEINNVPYLSREQIIRQAEYFQSSGADVIDLRCSLDKKFTDSPEVIQLLRARGLSVSIDTFDKDEILLADRAGVDFVLSLNGLNLELAEDLHCTVVVLPDFGEGLETLDRNIAHLERVGRPYIVDPILEPITSGFARSLDRYVRVRERHPAAEMLMGIGNITELTEADSTGVNALLLGFCQELGIRYVLTTEVIDWRGARCARWTWAPAHVRGHDPEGDPEAHRRPPPDGEGRAAEVLDRGRAASPPRRDHRPEPGWPTRARRSACSTTASSCTGPISRCCSTHCLWRPAHAFYLGKELMKARSRCAWARPTSRSSRCAGAISRGGESGHRECGWATGRRARNDAGGRTPRASDRLTTPGKDHGEGTAGSESLGVEGGLIMRRIAVATFVVWSSLLTAGLSGSVRADDFDTPQWTETRQALFQSRPIQEDASGVVQLEVPLRPDDAAAVPVLIKIKSSKPPEQTVKNPTW